MLKTIEAWVKVEKVKEFSELADTIIERIKKEEKISVIEFDDGFSTILAEVIKERMREIGYLVTEHPHDSHIFIIINQDKVNEEFICLDGIDYSKYPL